LADLRLLCGQLLAKGTQTYGGLQPLRGGLPGTIVRGRLEAERTELEETFVQLGIMLLHERGKGLRGGPEQVLKEAKFCALGLQLFSGDPVGLQHALHEPLSRQDRLRLEQVSLTLFRRQPINCLIDQPAHQPFLFILGYPELDRKISQQQLLGRVVVNDRSCELALISADRAV